MIEAGDDRDGSRARGEEGGGCKAVPLDEEDGSRLNETDWGERSVGRWSGEGEGDAFESDFGQEGADTESEGECKESCAAECIKEAAWRR